MHARMCSCERTSSPVARACGAVLDTAGDGSELRPRRATFLRMSTEPINRPTTTEPRASRWRSVLEVVPFAIGGGLVAAAGVSVGEYFGLQTRGSLPTLHFSTIQTALLITVSIVALIGTIVVHELGHLLGGVLVGFRAFLLIVGPLRFERSASGWRVAMNRSIALAGGLAGTAPTDTYRVRQRMAVVVAGGPLASVITGALALAWCLFLRPFEFDMATPFGRVLLAAALAAYGFGSCGIGLITLIPGRTSGFRTDGAQLLTFLRGGAEGDRAAALGAIVGQSLSGVRPRDYTRELLATAMRPEDGSGEELAAWQLSLATAVDSGDEATARTLLDRILGALDRAPSLTVATQRYDAALLFARWGDLERAREQLAAAGGAPAFAAEHLPPMARAAIAIGEHDAESARALLAEARRLLERSFDPGGLQMSREILDELERLATLETKAPGTL
jgi:hypothetical protein